MRERTYALPLFIGALLLALLFFVLGRMGILGFFTNTVQTIFLPVGQMVIQQNKTSVTALQKENITLSQQLATYNQLAADNKALRDQFQSQTISSQTLIPVQVVGMPGTIPNVSFPERLIIHAGKKDGVGVGESVIADSMLVGIVSQVTDFFAEVQVISSRGSSYSVKDSSTGAIGVARGQGSGEILMDNVQLADTLKPGDIIVSLGSQDVHGKGMLPNVIIGKIVSVDKNPSNLFQTARIVPLIAFDRLSTVFVSK